MRWRFLIDCCYALRWAQPDLGSSCKTRGKRFSRLSTTPVMPSGRLASERITAECTVFNIEGALDETFFLGKLPGRSRLIASDSLPALLPL
jgi:hypothetical protein